MAHSGGEYDIDGGNTHRKKTGIDHDGFVFDPGSGGNPDGNDDGWCIGFRVPVPGGDDDGWCRVQSIVAVEGSQSAAHLLYQDFLVIV